MIIEYISVKISGDHEYRRTNKDGSYSDLPADYFRLDKPFIYRIGKKVFVCIPPGFCYDGTSFGDHFGDSLRPGTGHDWDYFSGRVSRPEADLVFYYGCKVCVGTLRAMGYYVGVRLFGLSSWLRHRKNDGCKRKVELIELSKKELHTWEEGK